MHAPHERDKQRKVCVSEPFVKTVRNATGAVGEREVYTLPGERDGHGATAFQSVDESKRTRD